MALSLSATYEQLPSSLRPERTGQNAIERLAVDVVRREVAAMPASLVVQLALWPDEVAGWAREIRASESLVYNMLASRKPYARTRALLADRLGVTIAVVDHLIEARRPEPTARRGPGVIEGLPEALVDASEPIDWSRPPFARRRDGTNPIERRAVRVIEVDVASLPAATVVGLAIWPETLAGWSRAERLKASVVWATLAGSPSAPVRDALARRLGASLRELDALVTLARAVPVARRPTGPGGATAIDRTVAAPPSSAVLPPAEVATGLPPHSKGSNAAPRDEQLGFDL